MNPTFSILGRTALRIGDNWSETWGPQRERAMLATLLVHAGRPVPFDTLISWVWPEDTPPPRNRVPTFHTYATRIRRSIIQTNSPVALIGENGAYRLDVDRSLIDYHRFRGLALDARGLLRQGQPARALDVASRAISLWRGQPLSDLRTEPAENWRRRVLADEWLPVNTTVVEALLAIREFAAALSRVDDLRAEYPNDLRVIELHLAALHGLARYADVTAAYFSARRRFLEDSDLQAAEHLQRFHEGLVNRQPASGAPAGQPQNAVVPRQLPHDNQDFVGREPLLKALSEASTTASGDPVPTVVVLDGAAGVGKTALAIRWAHRHRDRFPDGDMYTNLNGFSGEAPVPYSTVVDDFLIALGHPPDSSMSSRSRELLLSRLLATRKILIVLDNVRDSAQIKDLLPLLSGCLVVVTSRRRLSSLSVATGARRIRVNPMPDDEATTLLSARLGGRRLAPGLRAQLVQLCGGLPLLITLLAGHVATWTDEQVSGFAAQVNRRQLILDVGSDEAANAGTFFAWSYDALATAERRLFRLLGLHPGADISTDLAAAYDGRTRAETITSLGTLVGAHLLEQPDAFDRYRFHDLLRMFAAICAERDEPADQQREAELRALTYYVTSAAAADRLLYPTRMAAPALADPPEVTPTEFVDGTQAKVWFDKERTNLAAVVRHAAGHGYHDQVWRLVDTVATFCDRCGYYTDSRDLREIAAASAAAAGLHEAEASTLAGLGMVQMIIGDHAQARQSLDAALRFAENAGNIRGQASALHLLGRLELARGNTPAAVRLFRRCLDLAQQSDDAEVQCWTHCRLGEALRALDQQDEAFINLHEAKRLAQRIGEEAAHARSLAEIGAIHRDQGDYRAAAAHCHQALRIAETVPDAAIIVHVCLTLSGIGRVSGDHSTAIDYARRAADVCRRTHNLVDEARANDILGDAYFTNGDIREAVQAWQAASERYEQTGNANAAIRTHAKIEHVPGATPDLPSARTAQSPNPNQVKPHDPSGGPHVPVSGTGPG